MNAEEALKLCRLAKALSPAQAVDEYTPEAWQMVLAKYRFADAQQALTELAGQQEWVHVSHIVQRIKQIRAKRLAEHPPVEPQPGLSDEDYATWLR